MASLESRNAGQDRPIVEFNVERYLALTDSGFAAVNERCFFRLGCMLDHATRDLTSRANSWICASSRFARIITRRPALPRATIGKNNGDA